ncbi:MAG: Wzz/FepE/Etk N-terminal domain-containing protein [Alphaproteobacteria bacterium]
MTTAKTEPQLDLVRPEGRAEPIAAPEASSPEPVAQVRPLPPRPAEAEPPRPEARHETPVRARETARGADPLALPDVVSLRDVVLRLVRGWWIILLTAAAAAALAFLYLRGAPVEYTATLILSSVEDSGGASVPTTQAVGTLTTLLGGTGQSESVSDYTRFRYLMLSRDVARRLMDRSDIDKVVFAKEWDEANQRWMPAPGWRTAVRRWIGETFGIPWYAEPSVDRVAGYLERRLKISNVEATPMVKVEFSHRDPTFARTLLDDIYHETDRLMREHDRISTEDSIAYLNDALSRATIVEHRLALQQLLLRNLAKLMLLDTDQPFAARMLELPYASPLPTAPNALLVLILASIGGVVLGIVMVLCVDALRGR